MSASGFSVLIPARMASTRLPDKPLADIAGLPMVVRVARQAALSAARDVWVAADDVRIVSACEQHGVKAIMTDAHHQSGSDRLAQACQRLGLDGDDVVVNVQGDEPLIDPSLIDSVAGSLLEHTNCVMSTAAYPLDDADQLHDPNVVKVVTDREGRALYFSRAPIPFWRDAPTRSSLPSPAPMRHVGIYAYRAGFLRGFPDLEPAPMESLESLEQLRVLWHGGRIVVHASSLAPAPGIDTPQDLERVRALMGHGSPS